MPTLNDYIHSNFGLPNPGAVNDKMISFFSHLYTGEGVPTIEGLPGSFYFDIVNGEMYTTANGIDWSLGSGGEGGTSFITPTTVAAAGSTRTLDLNGEPAGIFLVTLDQTSCALTYSGFTANKYSVMLVIIIQPVAGGKAITHASTIAQWDGLNNTPHILQGASQQTAYIIKSFDGTTLYGEHDQRVVKYVFNWPGAVTVGAGALRVKPKSEGKIIAVDASAGTAPSGGALTFDLNKNGTTMYSTQGDRPSILDGTNTVISALPAITTYTTPTTDYFTADIDVASGTPANATLQFLGLEP